MPNGKVFFLGGNSNTAIYTPSGNTNPGTWVAGPPIPNGQVVGDGPAAMMANGKILFGASASLATGATYFYEYDYVSNTYTPVSSPDGGTFWDGSYGPFVSTMLDLPDGSVLWHYLGSQAYVYKPAGKPLPAGRPKIRSVKQNLDGSYHLTGTLFNGISEGAYFGDDWQMNSNYPIARLKDVAGHVYYARTYNWSDTGVQTGKKVVSTEMTLPAGLPCGTYSLTISANSISSDDGEFSIRIP